MLDFCGLKIEGDIESNVKNIFYKRVYQLSSSKILPQLNQNYSAENALTGTYHIPN